MFVVRGSQTSSPDLANKTPPPVSMSNPKLRDTTFSKNGTGERIDEPPSRKGRSVIVVLAVAGAAAVAGVMIFRDGEKVGGQAARTEVKTEIQPAVPGPPKTEPVPTTAVDPPAPKTVTVHVESDPPGASVVNAASGGVLGVTPLVLTRQKGGSLKLRLEKDGFAANERTVSLEDDQTLQLTLEHKSKPRPHHAHAAPADDGPAKL